MRKPWKTPPKPDQWRIHFWVYANQPGGKGLRYDIDFGAGTAFGGAVGQLNITADTLASIKSEALCFKVTKLSEPQYLAWNLFVGIDYATLDIADDLFKTAAYEFTYKIPGLSDALRYVSERELSKVSNCFIFSLEASAEAWLISKGRGK